MKSFLWVTKKKKFYCLALVFTLGNVSFKRLPLYLICQLGEQLAQQVPISGVDVVELEDEGTCVRFNPLMTAAGKIFGR